MISKEEAVGQPNQAYSGSFIKKHWTPAEPDEVIAEFTKLLRGPTGDGAGKRRVGEKVSWKVDPGHVQAAFRHIGYWADGEQVDKDSGCHPLVHAAWRLLAVAWQENQDYVKDAN